MKPIFVIAMAVTILLGGCHSTKRLPLELVILPDMSGSIDPNSQRQMFAAIEDIALHLHRGDRLIVIPITGDARGELSGRLLRYEVPTTENRVAYDEDLKKLREQVKGDLTQLAQDAAEYPGRHTDLLGSIQTGLRTFSIRSTQKKLFVLSDFIQDTDDVDFDHDARIRNPRTAVDFAHTLRRKVDWPSSVEIVMGRLNSSEFSHLLASRRRAIDAFWSEYCKPAAVASDGIDSLRIEDRKESSSP